MKFVFIPKADYRIGHIIDVPGHGWMRIESYSHTGKSVILHTLEDAKRFERVTGICTDEAPIEEMSI